MLKNEKEEKALALSTKLKTELPQGVVFTWNGNFTLTFSIDDKPILTVYYHDHLPKETDANYLTKCVNNIINK